MVAVRQDRAPSWVTPARYSSPSPPPWRRGMGRGGLTRPLPAPLDFKPAPSHFFGSPHPMTPLPFQYQTAREFQHPLDEQLGRSYPPLHDAFLYVQFDAY